MAAKEPIFEFFRQRRQLQQQARRHGRQRQCCGVVGIDRRRDLYRDLDENRFLIPEWPALEVLGDDDPNFLGGGTRKHVALLGAGAFDPNLVGERFLAPGYLFGI